DRSWQSFAPVMATSVTDGNIIYAAHSVAVVDSVISGGDTTVYMNYDILLHRSNDAGANWETPINVTQTPDFMEVGVHLDPDAFDDRVYLAYQVPSEIETINPVEVWEDHMMWVYFMNAEWDPSINPVSVEERMPNNYTLEQNYPNPFNPVTTINYTVPTSEMLTLKVYNIAGQLVATLADGVAEAGSHTVQFDGSKLSSGVYFYQLSGASVNLTQKMVLMK
ncbi:MAG TPA: T9SS type A sorting domain-containing protein, partial [Candidatus Marinimicrobia bacterium]|nr:T9SS type A sorting domain-containing protein [Candidatus Neomarinimicrobiota bacterium]